MLGKFPASSPSMKTLANSSLIIRRSGRHVGPTYRSLLLQRIALLSWTSRSSFRMDQLDRYHPPPLPCYHPRRHFLEEYERIHLDQTPPSSLLNEIVSTQRSPWLSHSHSLSASSTTSSYYGATSPSSSSASRDEHGLKWPGFSNETFSFSGFTCTFFSLSLSYTFFSLYQSFGLASVYVAIRQTKFETKVLAEDMMQSGEGSF